MEPDDFTRDGPWPTARFDGWQLRVLAADEPGPVDFEVVENDGRVWGGTAATIDQIRGLMDRWRGSGECLGGRYLWVTSLVVVRDLSPDEIAVVVRDLIQTGDIVHALSPLEPRP